MFGSFRFLFSRPAGRPAGQLGSTLHPGERGFGSSVAINQDGTRIVVGSPQYDLVQQKAAPNNLIAAFGRSVVFSWSGSDWAADFDSAARVAGTWNASENSNENRGSAVAMNQVGDIVLEGTPGGDNGMGYCLAWRRTTPTYWTLGFGGASGSPDQAGFDNGLYGGPGEYIGTSVAISADGKVAAAGGMKNIAYSGKAIVRRTTASVGPYETLTNGYVLSGSSGEFVGGGLSLSGDGTVLAAAAPGTDLPGTTPSRGKVRLYKWSSQGPWSRMGSDIDGVSDGDWFGRSVGLSGDGSVLVVGAPYAKTNGTVRVFAWNGSSWLQRGGDIDGVGSSHSAGMGYSVCISNDGNTVAVGAPYDDGNIANSGRISVYGWVGSTWTKKCDDICGSVDEALGTSLALSGDGKTLVAGSDPYYGNVKVFGIPQ